MASVNNATGVYGTLGYNFSDPNGDIMNFSSNTVAHLNSIPALLTSNQAQVIVASGNSPINLSNFYQNPLANVIITITNTANSFISNTSSISNTYPNFNVFVNLVNTAIHLVNVANSFLYHTNRLSNLIPFDGTDSVNPYYKQAIAYGKIGTYITNQTDNVQNTSTILGSFTSLFIGPQLNSNSSIISTDYINYQTNVTANTVTLNQYTQIANDMNVIVTLMSTRQAADVTFYTNLKNMVNNFNTARSFSGMGESEKFLVTTFIGTNNAINLMN